MYVSLCLRRGIRSLELESWVAVSCLAMLQENKPWCFVLFLEEQQVFLAPKPSLQSPSLCL